MNVKPLYDRLVVKRVDADTVSAGGIFIPDNATEKPDQGTVMSVGTGRIYGEGTVVPLSINVNDRVLFSKGAGHLVKIDGEELIVLKEEEVLAIIEE